MNPQTVNPTQAACTLKIDIIIYNTTLLISSSSNFGHVLKIS